MPDDVLLRAEHLTKSFAGFVAVKDVSLDVTRGSIHALIGPNGAGKTTFINLVTGRLSPSSGRILLGGTDVTSLAPEGRVKRGIGRTFQINALFNRLTVLENVVLAVGERHGIAGDMLRSAGRHGAVIDEAYALLERLALADDAGRLVRELPYGRQRLVEIAIALGLAPQVLLLDEPAAGVAAAETGLILDIIENLPPEIAVLIIEHDMELVFRVAQRITVLVQGAILVEGSPAEIAADERVQEVYLGKAQHR
jgi:branched-chain amino acid transport system ATP-binding protein